MSIAEHLIFALKTLPLILLAWLAITSLYRAVKSNTVKIAAFFALAFYGAYAYSGVIIAGNGSWIEQILAAIHGATLFFVPKRDFFPDDFNNDIHFFIFHFLSLLYLVLIGSAIWGRKSLNRSGLWLIPVGKRNVFWGFSEGGMSLAKNIIADSERAIFILPDKKKQTMRCLTNSTKFAPQFCIAIGIKNPISTDIGIFS
ncbi:MAG: hypothetical protein LBJ63_01130 [Prevotellaceae bacterium]|jgi:hypothetical protein|nr:hypothetical protein [Prevotellaceae bacterium]